MIRMALGVEGYAMMGYSERIEALGVDGYAMMGYSEHIEVLGVEGNFLY